MSLIANILVEVYRMGCALNSIITSLGVEWAHLKLAQPLSQLEVDAKRVRNMYKSVELHSSRMLFRYF